MKYIRCDRCGEEQMLFLAEDYYASFTISVPEEERNVDLCEKCTSLFLEDFLEGKEVEAENN